MYWQKNPKTTAFGKELLLFGFLTIFLSLNCELRYFTFKKIQFQILDYCSLATASAAVWLTFITKSFLCIATLLHFNAIIMAKMIMDVVMQSDHPSIIHPRIAWAVPFARIQATPMKLSQADQAFIRHKPRVSSRGFHLIACLTSISREHNPFTSAVIRAS